MRPDDALAISLHPTGEDSRVATLTGWEARL
jgi:hypothetical protein